MDKAQMTGLEYCRSHPLNAQNIPDILKDLSRWVVWKAFDENLTVDLIRFLSARCQAAKLITWTKSTKDPLSRQSRPIMEALVTE
mgnify:CR=1 FL=1|tara:strand:+ start:419 stop:673 length:255 start_codon:yes stop_codon:yes gene_type:complete